MNFISAIFLRVWHLNYMEDLESIGGGDCLDIFVCRTYEINSTLLKFSEYCFLRWILRFFCWLHYSIFWWTKSILLECCIMFSSNSNTSCGLGSLLELYRFGRGYMSNQNLVYLRHGFSGVFAKGWAISYRQYGLAFQSWQFVRSPSATIFNIKSPEGESLFHIYSRTSLLSMHEISQK
jgi:hypothetical protein